MNMRRNHLYVGIGVLVVILFTGSVGVSHANIIQFSFEDNTGEPGNFLLNLPADGKYHNDGDEWWEFDKSIILDFIYRDITLASITSFTAQHLDTDISLWSMANNIAESSDLNFAFSGGGLVESLSDMSSAYTFLYGSITVGDVGYDFDSMTVTPVPEPSCLTFLFLTLLCLGAVGSRGYSWGIGRGKRVQRNG